MDHSNLAKNLNQFFIDRDKLEITLKQIEEKKDISQQEINTLLQQLEQWTTYPSFYRSIEHNFKKLQEISILSTPSIKNNHEIVPTTTSSSSTLKIITPSPTTAQSSSQITSTKPSHQQLSSSHQQYSQPSSSTINNFFRSQGIVGEEATQEILIYGSLAKANIGIESLSGSGKSALLYALLKALPQESYQIIDQATGKSLYNNPNINKTEFWIIPELQKIFSQDIEEIIKNLTEGIATTYTKTNKTKDGIDSFTIQKKSVIYAFAITNKHLKNRDEEFYRRFIILPTDISKEQNKRIALNFAQREFEEDNSQNQQNDYKLLPHHLKSCLEYKGEIKNPFLEYILSSLPEEISTQLRFRSSLKYLQSLTKGCTLYHTNQSQRQEKTIFTTIYDAQKTLTLYQPILANNIFNLNVIDQALLSLTPTETPTKKLTEEESLPLEPLTLQTLQSNFYERYPALDLEESIDKLLQQGLIYKKNNVIFQKQIPQINLDLEQALHYASDLMLKHFPTEHDSWYSQCNRQLEEGANNE